MPVNETLASFSDFSFKAAFAFYILGLFVMLAYYMRERLRVESEQELKAIGADSSGAAHNLVSVGARKANGDSATADSATNDAEHTTASDATDSARSNGGVLGRGKAWFTKPDVLPTKAELEHTRIRNDQIALGGQALILVGVVFHAACVVLRGMSASRFPWGNLYEYIALSTLVAMVVATVILASRENRIMWPWVLAPVIGLLFYGGFKLYAASAPVVPALQSYWFPIHVSTVSIGASFGLISGVCSVLYILRMWQPQGMERGKVGKMLISPLPTARKLDRMAYRMAIIAFPVFGLGVVFGAIWAESAWGRFWGWDPKEVMALVSWIAYAAYLHARATSGWRNTAAAWINIFAFGTMVFNLFFINLVVSGLHSYAGLN